MTAGWKNEPQYIELKKDFKNSLLKRRSDLEMIQSELSSENDLNGCAGKYHFIVHKLAGVARSFDFTKLADLSELEDEKWADILESKAVINEAELKNSLSLMIKELDAHS